MARPRIPKRVLAGLFPFVFSILAFTFSLLAVTSPEWASRHQYPDNTDAISQTDPIYTLFRSPFQICIGASTPVIDDESSPSTNSTTTDDVFDEEDDQPPPPVPSNFVYTTSCTHYHIYGKNKTSCELPSVVGTNLAPQVGDARQCQQIHLAGNYQVASAVFLGVTLLTTLVLFFVSIADSLKYPTSHPENGASTNHLAHVHHFPKTLSILPTLLFPLVVTGVITAIISQFYAIMGLVQSAPNNGDFTTSQGNREHHDPWMQGKGLSVYLSLSWFWALLAGWSGWVVWGGSGNGHRYAGKSLKGGEVAAGEKVN